MEFTEADNGVDETVSVTFSGISSWAGRLSLSRMLPKDGRAGRGFMKSSNSFSFSAIGLHLDALRPTGGGDFSASAYAEVPATTGSASKLTRTLRRFFLDPLSEVVSEASLGVPLLRSPVFCAAGELPRLETEGDDLRADLAGEMERGGGWCLMPANSTATGAKWALRGGLMLCPRSFGVRTLLRPCPARVFVVVGTTGVGSRG